MSRTRNESLKEKYKARSIEKKKFARKLID